MKKDIFKPQKSDYQEIITLWELSVRATHHFLNEEDIQRYKQLIFNEYLDLVSLFCIKDKGRIIGFMGLNDDEIQMLFIHPDSIGKGIGKQLLLFAIKAKRIKKVSVNEQNTQALEFYKHFRFEVTERYAQDAANKPYPILGMEIR